MTKISTLGLALLAITASAAAQNERDSARKAAEAMFHKMDWAINTGHMASYWSMFAPGYYSVDTEGRLYTLSQVRAMVAGAMNSGRNAHSTTAVKNVQLMDKEEVVWIEQRFSWEQNMNGHWMPMVQTTRWAENLKMVNGAWKFGSSQQLMTNEPWSFKTNGG
jgi:hypothetical protein